MIIDDVIIPFHPKDTPTVKLCCESLKNVIGAKRIILISSQDPKIDGCEFINETSIDNLISLKDIKEVWAQKNQKLMSRSGWLYQQLLKLAVPDLIPDVSEDFLISDSDIVFLKNPYANIPQGVFPYSKAFTGEYHLPYRKSYERLMKETTVSGFSFINHNMVVNKQTLNSLKKYIQDISKTSWDQAILNCIDFNEASCFSEYDLYGNWAFQKMQCEQVQMNIAQINFVPTFEHLHKISQLDYYHIVSSQEWQRTNR